MGSRGLSTKGPIGLLFQKFAWRASRIFELSESFEGFGACVCVRF